MKKALLLSLILLQFIGLASCTTFDSPEEELCAILAKDGWVQISNHTNVYRLDLDYRAGRGKYKTTHWYTASIYSKAVGYENQYIIARVVYSDGVARRENGKLVYKTFPIVGCNYTDKYNKTYNGYIIDSGCTAYLNY